MRSMAGIVDTLSDQTSLLLIARDRDLGSSKPYSGLSGRWVTRGRSRIFYLDARNPKQWLRLRRELRTTPFDLLYVNSLWDPSFTMIPIFSVMFGLIRARTILIAPSGQLSPAALSLKDRKKRFVLKWWAPLLRSLNVIWHASSDKEAAQIRAVLPWARIEVSENQVLLPFEPLPATALNEGPTRLVFIGRISPMKNVALILEALRGVSRPVVFDIYGPREDVKYWSRCQALVRLVPDNIRVTYRGELASAEVRRAFYDYDAFVFPTRGENFGHVIAESLSASCPVLCSGETPWTQVLEGGGGAIVRSPTITGLRDELERVAAMSPDQRLRARQAAGDAYRVWRKAAVGPNILERARLAEWSPAP